MVRQQCAKLHDSGAEQPSISYLSSCYILWHEYSIAKQTWWTSPIRNWQLNRYVPLRLFYFHDFLR